MKIEFEISDNKVRNFSASAKTRLQEQAAKYTHEIISEAEKVEALLRENGASAEITENTIIQAVRRNKASAPKRIGLIVFRVVAEALLFIAGLMWMPDKFITTAGTFNVGYFSLFAIVALVALIATIVTYFVGGE